MSAASVRFGISRGIGSFSCFAVFACIGLAPSGASAEVVERVIFSSSAQRGGCTASLRPTTTDGSPASFVVSGRTNVHDWPVGQSLPGEAGSVSIADSGVGVQSASCEGSTGLSGVGAQAPELLSFRLDSSIPSAAVVLLLQDVTFGTQDNPVIYLSTPASDAFDHVISTAEVRTAFRPDGKGSGTIGFGWFTSISANTLIDGFAIVETSGEVYVAEAVILAPPAVSLQQVRNGTAASPNDPGSWANGNAGASNSHYVEGMSIPYRAVMTDLPTDGTIINLELGYDVKNSDKHAIDYLTHYDRLEPHATFVPLHTAETIDPTLGVAGVAGLPSSTFAIPAPSSAGSPKPGQPTNSFNALPAGERVFSLWNGTILGISYITQGDLNASQSETVIEVSFTASSPTAVLSWGGHIGYAVDWSPEGTAGGISGSPYHMRLKDWNLNNLGNQDRSLSADAVTGPCAGVTCDDNNLCTNDFCDPQTGECVYDPTVTCPSDGVYCNGLEVCDPLTGDCVSPGDPCGGSTPFCCEATDTCNEECCFDSDCNDNSLCTTDTCVAGVCQFAPVTCNDDGLYCNGGEICNPANGQCEVSGNPCGGLTPLCCEATDTCAAECCEDAACDDGDLCTNDGCVGGVCVTTPVICMDDGLYCNGDEVCDPNTGDCVSDGNPCAAPTPVCCEGTDVCEEECCLDTDCNDGNLCTTDTCNAGVCQFTPVTCPDDGLFCNGSEVCDPNTGDCVSDGNPCAAPTPVCCEGTDVCEEECCLDADCNDGNLCTTDTCNAGVCLFTPVTCMDDGLFCNGDEVCDPNTGGCVSDGNPCAAPTPVCCEGTDVCEEECCLDADCDDGNLCTTDTCNAGVCQFTPVTCMDDGLYCNGDEVCNPANGMCESTGDPCDPGFICCEATDICATECCDDVDCPNDGQFCTGQNLCVNGACKSTGGPCAPDEVCCEDTNTCAAACCDDADCPTDMVFCNGLEICVGGLCVSTGDPCGGLTPICCESADVCEEECCSDAECNDGELCTTDACVSGVCQYTPVSCTDDGVFCNGPEVCNPANGQCEAEGDPCGGGTPVCCEAADACEEECCADIDCDDGNLCTTDSCVDGVCEFPPVTCTDDGQFCNGPETCNPANGMCESQGDPCGGGTPVCCEAADACEEECCTNADCNDGNLCTTDACVAGVCQNSPVTCPSDGQFCNGVEACNPATGQCQSAGSPCVGNTAICCEASDSCAAECCVDGGCNDGNPCTTDRCLGGTCVNIEQADCCLTAAECEDGDDCTTDSCVGNVCLYNEIPGCRPVIPTTTHWGIAIMSLLLLVGARLYFGRRLERTAA